ncbi:MAG: YggS family pyridoxal phosphate-dependent enzyme [Deltaproteobacteria bacterium]|nr:YggS family pyridoxal phosphate-dependent enzyme [Deltaproteobacteria bacterium]
MSLYPIASESEAKDRLALVRHQIDEALRVSSRPKDDVKLLAVSKTFYDEILPFYRAGQLIFGENYMQEARDKVPRFPDDIEWHFIGRLQTNKARHAVNLFSVVQTLDKLELAAELDKRLLNLESTLDVYIQINISGEDSKNGLSPEALPAFLEGLERFSTLHVVGLMTMAPYDPDPELSRPHYAALRELRDKHAPRLKGLSMGMSDDFPVAISEGATIVRVGRALFGIRRRG